MEPGGGGLESVILTRLPEYGLGGIIALVLLYAIWYLNNKYYQVTQERFADWKAVSDILKEVSTRLSELGNTSNDRTRAQEAMARALDLAAQADQNLTNEVTRMREATESLRSELQKFREELLRRGS